MRVLDPTIRHPIYRLHDKATKAIGDGGTLATVSTVGVGLPVATGVLFNDLFALFSMLGWYGLVTFRGYKKNTKNKSRITTLVDIQNRLPASYRPALNKMVKEVFDCEKQHYDFKTSDTIGYRYKVTLDRGISTDTIRFHETEKQFKVRQAEEKILKLGYGCMYCGKRIQAAQTLLDECQAAEVEDNLSVENVLAIAAAKRESNVYYKQFMESESAAMKELTG